MIYCYYQLCELDMSDFRALIYRALNIISFELGGKYWLLSSLWLVSIVHLDQRKDTDALHWKQLSQTIPISNQPSHFDNAGFQK